MASLKYFSLSLSSRTSISLSGLFLSNKYFSDKDTILSIITKLNEQGFEHVDWNVDSYDSHYNKDENSIIKATLNNIKKNENNQIYTQNILMHDNTKKEGTIKALPKIIEYCLSKNYKFKTLDSISYLNQHVKRAT